MKSKKGYAVTLNEHGCEKMKPIRNVVGVSLIKCPDYENPMWFHVHETGLFAIFYCPYCGEKLEVEE